MKGREGAAGSARTVAREPLLMPAPVVVKIGGRALESAGAARELAAGIAALRQPVVIVHGGGAEVTEWCARLGHAPRFVDGLRVTDKATIEVVAAVLAGLANKRLVAALRAAGVDAVGLSALDGGLVEARLHPEAGRLGEVASVAGVDPALLETLLSAGRVPVLSSLVALGERLLNLNADDLAAALAPALGANELVLISDTPGVRLADGYVARLDRAELDAALVDPAVGGGMKPKLGAARRALEAGVARVHIAAWAGATTLTTLLSAHPPGTTLTARTEALHG